MAGRPRAPAARATEMARLYNGGRTLQSIGDDYGLTRERVRQIIKKHFGLTYQNSGRKAAIDARTDAAERKRTELLNRRCIEKNGMPREAYRALIRKRDASGINPQRRFLEQKRNARVRGIEWHLSFADWWRIWEESGKWGERGRGHGYAMSRPGDIGPYAVGNVKIIQGADNSREFITRMWAEAKNGTRVLKCGIGSKYCPDSLSVGGSIKVPPQHGQKLELMRNSAWFKARERGWKISVSTRGGVLTITRLS